jgi:monoamine oxidase
MRPVDVVVVGAGIAGLTAATTLHEQDLDVVCLEARDRVGGRACSQEGWLDLGATWFWDGQQAIADTVAALDLPTYRQVVDGDALVEQPDGSLARVQGNPIDRPAWRLRDGMQAVPTALAARLPDGAVVTGAAVTSIASGGDGPLLVRTDTETYVVAAVVLAVPPSLAVEAIAFEPALPPTVVEAARAVHTWMSDTVKVVARYERPFWRDAGLAGAALSHRGPFCEFHDHSGPDGQAALFGFAPAARVGGLPADELTEQFTAGAARLFGDEARKPLGVHVADWSTDRRTTASTPTTATVSWYYGTPLLRLPHLDGRLVFGSTETGPAFPGYLEGAVLAGRRGADQVHERVAGAAATT